MKRKKITVDGCTACALVAYATNELITIYPITPSSPWRRPAMPWRPRAG